MPLPSSFTLVSAAPSHGNCDGSASIRCSLGSLDPDAQAVVTFTLTAGRVGQHLNLAEVRAAEMDPDLNNNARQDAIQVNGVVFLPLVIKP